jgi:alanyl-tRNA synthetase
VSGVNKELVYAIADHIRAISFSVYDGVLPSNEARGYITRKLVRKSALHLRALGIKQPFLYKLVPVLSEIMKKPYPELDSRKEDIASIILAQEKNFISILNSSDNLFEGKFIGKPDADKAGLIAFQLYDTYGIPLELTKGWLDKNKIGFSKVAFEKELEQQKTRSKSQSAMKGEVFDLKELHLDVTGTKFLGYEGHSSKAKIIKIIQGSTEIKKAKKGEEAILILDKTVFYPESGGQIGDTGEIVKGENIFQVLDTKKASKAILHIGRVKQGAFKKSDLVLVNVDTERRLSIARNHTATHLLQAALRKVLGQHVKQQGSLVAEDRLRFDFTHFKDIEKEQLDRIEEVVNYYILNICPLQVKEMTFNQAKKKGALAFFGEKYTNKVRVVSISEFSQELCGGTHLDSTGQIGLFRITQESSVASGIRRIEATTGTFAYKLVKKDQDLLMQAASILNVEKERIPREVENKISRIKTLEKQISSQKAEEVKTSLDNLINQAEVVNGIKIITMEEKELDIGILRKTVDLIKEKTSNAVIALGSKTQGRALLVMGLTEDLLQKGLDASKLIVNIAAVLGGSGGGRKDFAQAGGTKPEDFSKAFEELKNQVSKIL